MMATYPPVSGLGLITSRTANITANKLLPNARLRQKARRSNQRIGVAVGKSRFCRTSHTNLRSMKY